MFKGVILLCFAATAVASPQYYGWGQAYATTVYSTVYVDSECPCTAVPPQSTECPEEEQLPPSTVGSIALASSNITATGTSAAQAAATTACVGPTTVGASCNADTVNCCGGLVCDVVKNQCVADDTSDLSGGNATSSAAAAATSGACATLTGVGSSCAVNNCCQLNLACDASSNTCVADDSS